MSTKDIKENKEYLGIDLFRVIAVILVVMNHTYPLASINETSDFILTRIIARIAVPFFFMVSGYFILPSIIGKDKDYSVVFKSIKKLIKLYVIATIVYLPIYIYSGYILGQKGLVDFLKDILFNGTFYHLWYLPGAIVVMVLVSILLKKLKLFNVLLITIFLYIIGLFGDSYYGITQNIPLINEFYKMLYTVFDYTRNGIFFAPLFLVLGAMISRQKIEPKKDIMMYGCLGILLLMILEGLLLNSFGVQRHSSMYILLVPVMYFLFQWILLWNEEEGMEFKNIKVNMRKWINIRSIRDVSMIVYIIHPLVIILIRGFSKVVKLQNILVDNSIIHFVVVLISSFVIAYGINYIKNQKMKYIISENTNLD